MTAGKTQDFTHLSGRTFHEDELSPRYFESQLCIPQDRLEDIDLFPNFDDDLIRLTEALLPELESFTSFDGVGCNQESVKDFCSTHDFESNCSDNGGKDPLSNRDLSSLDSGEVFDDTEQSFPISLEHEIQEWRARGKPVNLQHCFDDGELSIPASLGHDTDPKGRKLRISSLQPKSVSESISPEQGIEHNGRARRVSLQHNEINNDNIGWSKVLFVEKKKPRTQKPRKENRNLAFPLSISQDGNQNVLNTTKRKRSCIHCQAEETPQWRMGPTGRNTLCNACGLRYKSGRLVAEYRPTASPSFDSTKHSNYHRKIKQMNLCEEDNPGEVVNG